MIFFEPLDTISGSAAGSKVGLATGNPIDFDVDGHPIVTRVTDPAYFGQRWQFPNKPALHWKAVSEIRDLRQADKIVPFDGGALVNSEIRVIIEEYDSTGIEFIPLSVFYKGTEDLLDDQWSYVNVFNWKDDVFDFSQSKVEYRPFPEESYKSLIIPRRFGPKQIIKINELAARTTAYEGGFFLVGAPSNEICMEVFLGRELHKRISSALPAWHPNPFRKFALKNRPEPIPFPRALSKI